MIAVAGMFSCSRPMSHYNDQIDNAASVVAENQDSALSMLETIEPSELSDSLRAKYYYIMALAHENQDHLFLSDSLIGYSAAYYRDKDPNRAIRCAALLALYKYRIGEDKTAIMLLDSLSNLTDVPDSLLIFPMQQRAFLWTKMFEGVGNRPIIKRLISIDKDSIKHRKYKYWLYIDYLINGENDSALIVLNELIDWAKHEKLSSKQFSYEYEKVGILEEAGYYSESLALADKLIENAPGNSIGHYIHLWKSLALFNMGHRNQAIQELAKADSCASVISEAEKGYYNSFASVLKTAFDYQKTGKLRLIRMAQINNREKDRLFRIKSVRRAAERSALELENKRLSLKAKNEQQMTIIVIAGMLILGLLLWYALDRRRKMIEAEERAEALHNMVGELKVPDTSSTDKAALRRAMLQQLDIIKMVAETPTEENRKMLRKISSIESDNKSSLVNWKNVYDIIDNLYAGFYSRLHERYGDKLTDKEEQIIVLMMAGFSTKEISVITSQTTATIYVRKSSIRKKFGVAEKGDIIVFLRQEAFL